LLLFLLSHLVTALTEEGTASAAYAPYGVALKCPHKGSTKTGFKKTSEWKKAVVKLHPDNKLDLF